MNIILFLIILAVLILVHEFGHFIVAKKSGIRVDEFGLGFPPTLWSKTYGETKYSINAIPFGGFVKIFGENPDDESIDGPDRGRSFVHKSKLIQAAVLVAGITFNIIFAWLLISIGFMSGLPTPVNYGGAGVVKDAKVMVTSVAKDSPAAQAGIKEGDTIISLTSGKDSLGEITPENISAFVGSHDEVTVSYHRGQSAGTVSVKPALSPLVKDRKIIGISMDMIGILQLPIHQALWEGAKTTGDLIQVTAIGLANFIWNAVRGLGDFSQVSGPVGIIKTVGDVSKLGFIYLLSFTALISINLAVINLIPFPALDGGRLVFVAIEAIIRRPIKPQIANTVNGIGFVLLLLLMVIVTFHDVVKLF